MRYYLWLSLIIENITKIVLLLIIFLLVGIITVIFPADIVVSGEESPEKDKIIVESEIRHIYWWQDSNGNPEGRARVYIELHGEPASRLRKLIDSKSYGGDDDGFIREPEVEFYIERIEDRLENNLPLWSAEPRLPSRLLFKGIEITCANIKGEVGRGRRGYDGLVGTFVTDERTPVKLQLVLLGTVVKGDKFKLTDNEHVILYALFYDRDYNVNYKERIQVAHVSLSSYSDATVNEGYLWHLRAPVGQLLYYEYDGHTERQPQVTLKFNRFHLLESPPILFTVGLVCMILMFIIPRRLARKMQKRKVKSFHRGLAVIFGINAVLFVFGVAGIIIWVISIMGLLCSVYLGRKLYVQDWRKLASPLPPMQLSEEFAEFEDATELHREGVDRFRRGDLAGALKVLEHAVRVDSEDPVIWNDYGHVLRKSGRYEEALKCFEQALKLDPEFETAQRNLVLCKRDMNLL